MMNIYGNLAQITLHVARCIYIDGYIIITYSR